MPSRRIFLPELCVCVSKKDRQDRCILFHTSHTMTSTLEKAVEIALVCKNGARAAIGSWPTLWVKMLPFRVRLESGLASQQVSAHTQRVNASWAPLTQEKITVQWPKRKRFTINLLLFFVPVFFDCIKCLNDLSTFLPIQCCMSSLIAVLHSASSFYLASEATEIEFDTPLFCFSVLFYCYAFSHFIWIIRLQSYEIAKVKKALLKVKCGRL